MRQVRVPRAGIRRLGAVVPTYLDLLVVSTWHADQVAFPRGIRELTETDDPAWPSLSASLRAADAQILLIDDAAAKDAAAKDTAAQTLYRLQVTTRSTLGALAFHTAGVLIDHGWLRLLGGSGAHGLPSLAQVNHLPVEPSVDHRPPSLIVGYDIFGGAYAINAGDLPGEAGQVCYFAADQLGWRPLGIGHSAFVDWACRGGPATFYQDQRWPGWEAEVEAVPLSMGLSVYPPPWSAEGGDIAHASRRPVPLAELVGPYDAAG